LKILRGSKRQGQLFEERVNKELRKNLGRQYVKSPWLRYFLRNEKPRICQPDGIYIDAGNKIVTIVECKYTFCAQAWHQINKLYRPVIEAWHPEFKTRGVQVFKNYQPSIKYPESPRVIEFADIGNPEWVGGNKVCRWK